VAEDQVRTARGTIDEIRARAAGLHFAKEALTPGEREILYDLEAAISMLDGFAASGFFRGYRSEITSSTPRPQLRLTDLPPDPTSTVAGERLVLVTDRATGANLTKLRLDPAHGWRYFVPPSWSETHHPTAPEAADAAIGHMIAAGRSLL